MTAVVNDVMTAQVIWVEQDTPFAAIAAALRQYRVSAFPVLDEAGQVIGVVSESDLLSKLAFGGGEDGMPGMITGILRHKQLEKARGVTAGDLMTAPPVTVSPDDTIEHAARLMYLRQVKRLPVVDANGRLAGIVSRSDLLAVYGRSDAEIAEDIRTDVLPAEDAAEPVAFEVTVTDGVVTLAGRPESREQGHDIVGRTGHVQGVVAVRDRLDYPAPGPDAFDVLASFPVD
jgi:CBS domain-containing protein